MSFDLSQFQLMLDPLSGASLLLVIWLDRRLRRVENHLSYLSGLLDKNKKEVKE